MNTRSIRNTLLQATLAASFCLQASPTLALSCSFDTLAEVFNQLKSADDDYLLGYGTLTPKPGSPRILTAPDPSIDGSYSVESLFEGSFLTGNRSVGGSKVQRDVTVSESCLSADCGILFALRSPALIFLKLGADGGYSLRTGLCGGDYQKNPSLEQVGALNQCLRKGRCGRAEIEVFKIGNQ